MQQLVSLHASFQGVHKQRPRSEHQEALCWSFYVRLPFVSQAGGYGDRMAANRRWLAVHRR